MNKLIDYLCINTHKSYISIPTIPSIINIYLLLTLLTYMYMFREAYTVICLVCFYSFLCIYGRNEKFVVLTNNCSITHVKRTLIYQQVIQFLSDSMFHQRMQLQLKIRKYLALDNEILIASIV